MIRLKIKLLVRFGGCIIERHTWAVLKESHLSRMVRVLTTHYNNTLQFHRSSEWNIEEKFFVTITLNEAHSIESFVPGFEDSSSGVFRFFVETFEVVEVALLVQGVHGTQLIEPDMVVRRYPSSAAVT